MAQNNIDQDEFLREALVQFRAEADRTLSEIRNSSNQANSKVAEISAEVERAKENLRNLILAMRRQNDAQRAEFVQRFEALLKGYEERQEKNEAKLTELIGKATVGPISKRYGDKARDERFVGRWFLALFYLSLFVAGVFGGIVAWYSWRQLPEKFALWDALKTVLIRFVACTPIYIPLFWFIAHLNRWAVQKNRLAEEYEHKKLVVETYAGLEDQVESLVAKGVKTAPDLVCKQLEKTVEAVCFDACALLDKVQILTPIGEMASSASKVMSSATEFAKVAPDMKPA